MRKLFTANLAIVFGLLIGQLAFAPMAFAQAYKTPGGLKNMRYDALVSGSAFTALAINVAKQFDSVNIGGYHTALVEIQYTYASGTAVNMTCEQSPDNTVWLEIPEVDGILAPVIAHGQRIWRWTGAVSVSFFFEVPMRYRYLRCSIYTTGGGAGDVATVTITAAN